VAYAADTQDYNLGTTVSVEGTAASEYEAAAPPSAGSIGTEAAGLGLRQFRVGDNSGRCSHAHSRDGRDGTLLHSIIPRMHLDCAQSGKGKCTV